MHEADVRHLLSACSRYLVSPDTACSFDICRDLKIKAVIDTGGHFHLVDGPHTHVRLDRPGVVKVSDYCEAWLADACGPRFRPGAEGAVQGICDTRTGYVTSNVAVLIRWLNDLEDK